MKPVRLLRKFAAVAATGLIAMGVAAGTATTVSAIDEMNPGNSNEVFSAGNSGEVFTAGNSGEVFTLSNSGEVFTR